MKTLKFSLLLICAVFLVDCTKDLDRTPENGLTADKLFANEAGYRSALAKIYGGLSLTGNNGPDGSGDLGGIDEGFSSYLRNYWNLQELPTDEAVIGWNDQTIKDFHEMDWTPADNFLRAMYSRLFYQIALANSFIREADDAQLSARSISGSDSRSLRATPKRPISRPVSTERLAVNPTEANRAAHQPSRETDRQTPTKKLRGRNQHVEPFAASEVQTLTQGGLV